MNQYEQTIYNVAVGEGLSPLLAGFVTAQAAHETANFTSNVFVTCNNAFGYKYVKSSPYAVGPCTLSPENDSYAKYKSVEDSTKEVCGWVKRRNDKFSSVTTIEEFAAVLKAQGYYGDSEANYLAGLKKYYQSFKDDLVKAVYAHPEISTLTAITILGVVAFYTVKIFKVIKKK